MLAARWATFDAALARAPSELAGRAAEVVRVHEHAGASRVEVSVPAQTPRREDA
jgi:hypothetical protein